MNEEANRDPGSSASPEKRPSEPSEAAAKGFTRVMLKVAIPILLILGAVIGAGWMIRNSPRARPRRRSNKVAFLVEVVRAEETTRQAVVHAMGVTTPALKVEIHPQVQGEIVWMNKQLLPGGNVRKDEKLIRIDASDYYYAVKQTRSTVARAQSDLAVERGLQSVARKEYELLGKKIAGGDPKLMLRKPQLDSVKASLSGAKAALGKAQLDLRRTTIKAPFNAIVQSREINMGSRVTPNDKLFTLIGIDSYWVDVVVPVDQLQYIELPETPEKRGSWVRIRDEAAWKKGEHRMGRVLRLRPDLEEKGRMARLLVEVADPLALLPENKGKPRMLVGAYVAVEILGSSISSAVVLDRNLLRDGDNVWVLDQGRLSIRPVTIVLRGRKRVLIGSGLKPGEQVITTNLATPVEGMLLRVHSEKPKPKNDEEHGGRTKGP